jgi:inositol transport system substrate-binding protein
MSTMIQRKRLGLVVLVLAFITAIVIYYSLKQESTTELMDSTTLPVMKQPQTEMPPQTDPLRIGATFLGYQEAFPATIRKLMEAEAQERGIDLKVYNGRESTNQQIKHIEEMIRDQVDVIILNPVDAKGAVKGVELAIQANIPIIGVNAIVNTDQLLTYIGSNDIEAGEIAMQFIAEKINGEGSIVILNGIDGQSSSVQRTRGFTNILNHFPNIKILEQEYANWSSEESYALAKKWFTQHPGKIDAIVSQNDEMALGAVRYIKEAGLPHIPIIGVDGLPEALEAVKSGDLDATVFQDAAGQAIMTIDVAQRIANGGQLAKTYFIPFQIVTKDNVDSYLINE